MASLVIVVSAIFGSIMQTDTQTNVDDCHTPVTPIGMTVFCHKMFSTREIKSVEKTLTK